MEESKRIAELEAEINRYRTAEKLHEYDRQRISRFGKLVRPLGPDCNLNDELRHIEDQIVRDDRNLLIEEVQKLQKRLADLTLFAVSVDEYEQHIRHDERRKVLEEMSDLANRKIEDHRGHSDAVSMIAWAWVINETKRQLAALDQQEAKP